MSLAQSTVEIPEHDSAIKLNVAEWWGRFHVFRHHPLRNWAPMNK